MGVNFRIFIFLAFLFLAGKLSGQDALYREAKSALVLYDYKKAKDLFEKVKRMSVNESTYAHFFLAYCYYKQGDALQARIEWKQLLWENPNFQELYKVKYWLARSSFELGENLAALGYLSKIDTGDVKTMAQHFLDKLEDQELIELYENYKENMSLNELLINRLSRKVRNQIENKIWSELTRDENGSLKVKKTNKEKYHISLVLPFMFDTWENAESSATRNAWIYEFYQGIKLGLEEVNLNENWLELHVYDSKRSEKQLKKILPDIQQSDVIIGPLFPEPLEQFGKEEALQNILSINPLSSNDELATSYSSLWLMRPTYSTMAMKLADFTQKQHHTNPYFMCFYSTDKRDSTMAFIYIQEMLKAGYSLLEHGHLDEESAKSLQDKLTATHEVIYPKDSADSIALLPRRFIKERALKPDESDNKTLPAYSKEEEVIRPGLPQRKYVSYEMVLDIPENSIGHIALFTKNETVINNLLSAVAAREDSLRLYGLGEWLSIKSANYSLLEQLQVQVVDPQYIDDQNPAIEAVNLLIIERYHQIPTTFHYAGYETMKLISYILKNSRNHELTELDFIPGILYEGYQYDNNKGNSVVPIIQIKDLRKMRVDTTH